MTIRRAWRFVHSRDWFTWLGHAFAAACIVWAVHSIGGEWTARGAGSLAAFMVFAWREVSAAIDRLAAGTAYGRIVLDGALDLLAPTAAIVAVNVVLA